jgi:hypothetical protein
LIKLDKLFFQDISFKDTNPICKSDNYRTEMFKTFPQLRALDGVRRDCEVFSINEDAIKPDDKSKFDLSNFDFNIKKSIL